MGFTIDHGDWVDIAAPTVPDGWRPRSVIHHRKDGQIVRDVFEIDGKLYGRDGKALEPGSPKINFKFDMEKRVKTKGSSGTERIDPRHYFKQGL